MRKWKKIRAALAKELRGRETPLGNEPPPESNPLIIGSDDIDRIIYGHRCESLRQNADLDGSGIRKILRRAGNERHQSVKARLEFHPKITPLIGPNLLNQSVFLIKNEDRRLIRPRRAALWRDHGADGDGDVADDAGALRFVIFGASQVVDENQRENKEFSHNAGRFELIRESGEPTEARR